MTKEIEQNLNEVRKAFANVSEYSHKEMGEFLDEVAEMVITLRAVESNKYSSEFHTQVAEDMYGVGEKAERIAKILSRI